LYEYPERYSIQAQEGLIQVMRVMLNAADAFSLCWATAAMAISDE
jgi:hypothetical protein